jgi:hypothetical protein
MQMQQKATIHRPAPVRTADVDDVVASCEVDIYRLTLIVV